MAKIGKYYHGSTVVQDKTTVGTSFDKTKGHEHILLPSQPINTSGAFCSMIHGVYVRVKDIESGSTTPTITIRLCCDADGDYTFLPDTKAELALGLTTNTSGVGVVQFDLPLKHYFGDSTVYVFIKIDQGTCTFEASCLTWSE